MIDFFFFAGLFFIESNIAAATDDKQVTPIGFDNISWYDWVCQKFGFEYPCRGNKFRCFVPQERVGA